MFITAEQIHNKAQFFNRPACRSKEKNRYKISAGTRLTVKAADVNKGYSKHSSLTPVEILGVKWTDINNSDIIVFKTVFDGVYMIQEEQLLKEISSFMRNSGIRGRLPYIHINGEEGWECYSTPDTVHILKFLRANFHKYDVYTLEGSLVKTAKY